MVRDAQHSGHHLLQAGVLLALVLALLGLVGRLYAPPPQNREHNSGIVTRICDGDTMFVAGIGKVRLIGVDALDAHNEEKLRRQAAQLDMSNSEVRRWARIATMRARQFLEDRKVRLERGREPADQYGRPLAYVHVQVDGKEVLFNALLLQEGLAVAYRGFEHPHRELFLDLERVARKQNRGLWKDATRAP